VALIQAPRLEPGDAIGIVSPSWGGAGLFPHRLERGIQHLEALGFRVKIAPHARNQRGFVSDTAAHRVDDLHLMFADPEVKVIMAAIGGAHSCHLLPLLDYALIRDHPKILMGYSDMTVLNVAVWHKTGLLTFNGPALLTDFAEYPRMLEYTERCFLKAVTQAIPIGDIVPSPFWTEEFLDWGIKQDLTRPRKLEPSEGWVWLKPGRAEGTLIGGCIESLQHLRGTEYWPAWDGAILFFETSEERPLPETVDGILMDYENMGVFDRLRGMIAGRPMRYSEDEKRQLWEIILARTEGYSFPIIANMDFGHTAPQFTIPLGCRALIDTEAQRFAILDPAVS